METFGSDPEFVLVDQKGNPKSAIGVIPGTSEHRVYIGNNAYYQDNVLAECAIEPATSRDDAVAKFQRCFAAFAKMVHPYKLTTRAAVDYPASELTHPLAKVIGCEPEWCAYEIKVIPKPVAAFRAGKLRTAGGHVHIGDSGSIRKEWQAHYYVRMLDVFLGVPSLYMDHDPTSARRREIYGGLGTHRRKPYGVEYRVLGNFWLASPKLLGIIYDICEWTTAFVDNGGHLEFWKTDTQAITTALQDGTGFSSAFIATRYDVNHLRRTIQRSDREAGKTYMAVVRKHLPADIMRRIDEETRPAEYDFYKEWGL